MRSDTPKPDPADLRLPQRPAFELDDSDFIKPAFSRDPDIKIERIAYLPSIGVFGLLTMPGFSCYTVEREWRDNKPWVSCIPIGVYYLDLHEWRGQQALILLGVPGRSEIVIHPANFGRQLQGCIAPGQEIRCMNGTLGATDSVGTQGELMRLARPLFHDGDGNPIDFAQGGRMRPAIGITNANNEGVVQR